MNVPCSFMEFVFSSAEEGITMNKGCKTKPDKSQQSTAHVFNTEGWKSLGVRLGAFKSRLVVFMEYLFSCNFGGV